MGNLLSSIRSKHAAVAANATGGDGGAVTLNVSAIGNICQSVRNRSEKSISPEKTSINSLTDEVSAEIHSNPQKFSPCKNCGDIFFWNSVYDDLRNPTSLDDKRCLICAPPPSQSLIGRRLMLLADWIVEIDQHGKIVADVPRPSVARSSTTLDDSVPFSQRASCVVLACGRDHEPLTIWTTRPGKFQPSKFGKIAAEDLALMMSFED